MDNSKDVSQRLKYFKKFLGWGLLASAILVLSYIILLTLFPPWARNPDSPAMSDLRNLVTSLDAHYADYKRFPQHDKKPSLSISDGVTASFVTSLDGQHYCAIAFNTIEGNHLFIAFSESSVFWYIPFPKQGLITAEAL